MKLKLHFTFALLFIVHSLFSQTKILFDATKAESASNADWVIDADLHNLGFKSSGAAVGSGTESNPQQFPTPAQQTITASTAETYWSGALSSWGIDCVKMGYQVETLPYNGKITYGNSSNLQDLSRYKVFIVCEPNIVFSTTEKTAILNFVKNGGGLFMVSDHNISDRNNDGWDSPAIWNDFLTNNSIESNPFGISFDLANISGASTNIASLPNDSILNGVMGKVSEAEWFNGTTMTLTPTKNPLVSGKIFTTGSSTAGTTNLMFATSRYVNGKIAAIGDSSPCDDGTGDSGDTSLYDGYWSDAAGNHRPLLMNATIWLATSTTITSTNDVPAEKPDINIFPNPVKSGIIHIGFSSGGNDPVSAELIDVAGKVYKTTLFTNSGTLTENMDVSGISSGIYFCRISTAKYTITKLVVIAAK